MSSENVHIESLFNADPYYDDYDADKKFLRTLFRPGFAVQARELTQLQTILQTQVARVADNIFEDGSLISGGQVTETKVKYLRFNTDIEKEDPNNPGSFISVSDPTERLQRLETIANIVATSTANSNIKARVYTYQDAVTNDDYLVLFLEYLTGLGTFTAGNTITISDAALGLTRLTVATTTNDIKSTDDAIIVQITEGVFYVDGFFVLSSAQSVVPFELATADNRRERSTDNATPIGSRLFVEPSARVGLVSTRSIVTDIDDATLLDPAVGAPNQGAPGADRYKIDLTLTSFEWTETGANSRDLSNYSTDGFIEIVRIRQGVTIRRRNQTDYAQLEKTLARRTFDESGSYTVSPFDINIREHLNDGTTGSDGVYTAAAGGVETKLAAGLEPGTAYVRGFLTETLGTEFVNVDKARTTRSASNVAINADIGLYVAIGATIGTDFGASFSIQGSQYNLYSGEGSTLGSARIRMLRPGIGDTYNLYLFDLQGLTSGSDLGALKYIRAQGSTDSLFEIDPSVGQTGGRTTYFNSSPNTLIFPLPIGEATESVNSATYKVQQQFSFTTDGSGNASISAPSGIGNAAVFPGTDSVVVSSGVLASDYIAIDEDGKIPDLSGKLTPSSQQLQLDIAGLTASTDYDLLVSLDVSASGNDFTGTYRTKTFESGSASGITLGITSSFRIQRSDIYQINSITDFGVNGVSGVDVTDRYRFDNGQRDNFYDWARLTLKAGQTAPVGPLTITYNYFSHAGKGPFVVNSYPQGASFGYKDIPDYRSERTGETVNLRDVIDFRPVKNTSGVLEDFWLPVPGETFRSGWAYYLPRIDKVVLTEDRRFSVVKGVPAPEPVLPTDDPSSMTLYILRLGAYTFGPDDVQVKYVDNRRYTMRDIGEIENRLDDLEHTTKLSLLEQKTQLRSFVGVTDGLEIPKTSILTDDFRGHAVGDVLNEDYNCAIDAENGELRPAFLSDNVDLVEDTNFTVTNIRKHNIGSGVFTLNYLDESLVSAVAQPVASTETIAVNPTGRTDYLGSLSVTPEGDVWYDRTSKPAVKSNKTRANDAWAAGDITGFGKEWNDWERRWSGIQNLSNAINPEVDLQSADSLLVSREFGPRSANIRARTNPDGIRKRVEERVLDTSVVPYARSRTVDVVARNMRPLTECFVFVDDTDVTNSVQGTNVQTSPRRVVTNVKGEASFSFVLPSSTIRTGDRRIRLIDSETNDLESCSTSADFIFRAKGTISKRIGDTKSTRAPIVQRASATSSKIFTSVYSRDQQQGSVPVGLDPLAQTFVVDRSLYPRGVFMKRLDLLFSQISSDVNVPVSVEIRPIEGDAPNPSKIVPFSQKTLYPGVVERNADNLIVNQLVAVPVNENPDLYSLNANGDPDHRSMFTFDAPVYLAPGDYAIVIKTNSPDYVLYAPTVGSSSIATSGGRVTKQPFVGDLFEPQNAGNWKRNTSRNLTFNLSRCDFNTANGIMSLQNETIADGASVRFDTFKVLGETLPIELLDQSKSISYLAFSTAENSSTINSTGYEIDINSNEQPSSDRGTQIIIRNANPVDETFRLVSVMRTDTSVLSPVLDAERFSVICVQNDVNESSTTTSANSTSDPATASTQPSYNGEIDSSPLANVTTTESNVSSSRYITKRVTLADGMESSEVRVLLDQNTPTGTSIQVFARVLRDDDDVDWDDKGYIQLFPDVSITNTHPNVFNEVSYSAANKTPFGSFKVYAVKIVLHSNDTFRVPRVRNMRAVSLV